MDNKEIAKAIKFNRNQGFAKCEIRMIQKTISAPTDGLWGNETVRALYQWQQDHGITPDGMVWKNEQGNTWPHILTAVNGSNEQEVRIGCWIDDRKLHVLKDKYFDNLVNLGISTAALMIDTSTKSWNPSWNGKDLARAHALANPRGIEIVLTTWPYPDRSIIDDMVDSLVTFCDTQFVSGIEIDVEFNWKAKHVKGFLNLQEASDYLASRLRPIAKRLELTTVPMHRENSSKAQLAPYVDIVFPQAYSQRKRLSRNGWKDVPFNHIHGPGKIQKLAIDRASCIPGDIEVGCALPAYFQSWADKDPVEVMKIAYNAAVNLGCKHLRYWSSKWILGRRANGYSAEFLKSL